MNFIVEIENLRLDKFLSDKLKTSRNQVAKLIKDKGVFINEVLVKKSSHILIKDDKINVYLPNITKEKDNFKLNFDVEILHEDEDVLVINKPPFLTVHQAPSVKEATLVDWLKSKGFKLSTLNGDERVGIVHRIDKQTSGALIVAKSNKAHQFLSDQLANKTLGRYYLALIDNPLKQNCIVEKPIGRNSKNRLKMDIVEGGRYAKSAFCSLLSNEEAKVDLIAAKLYTGRTHQIRVHLKSLSRHIFGDNLYDFKSQKAKIPRVMLHAYVLYFLHPVSRQKVFIKAPLFDDFNTLCEKYFTRSELEKNTNQDFIIDCFSNADSWLRKTT